MKTILFCDSKNSNCLKGLENNHENLQVCKGCEYYNEKAEMVATSQSWYEHEKDELEHTAW